MKKSELKNIIKECVKEVIFEEGVLASIITEVAQGLTTASLIQEVQGPRPSATSTRQVAETRKHVQDAVALNSYQEAKKHFSNPDLFEGTKPAAPEMSARQSAGPLGNKDPSDAGVDISSIPGIGNWSNVAKATRK